VRPLRLVIDGYGKFVGKRDNQIVIKENGHEIDYFLAEKVSQIIITGKGSVSFDALKLMALSNVDVVILNWTGDIIYRISPPELKNSRVRREQYKAYDDERSSILCKEIIKSKMENQKALLGFLAKSREEDALKIRGYRDKISEFSISLSNLENTNIDNIRGKIFGLEGMASSEYWKGIGLVVGEGWNFKGRSGRGAKDGFNALLNYGYGVLKGEVWRAIHLASMDPYAGFLHADRWGRPSLVFDLMEEFRQQIVDRSILKLIIRKQIKIADFTFEEGRCRISDKARKKLIAQILKRLDSYVKFNGRNISFSDVIVFQARLMTKFLVGEVEYKGFYLRW
jgi:CRISPR-associated protein Cas1